jgi:hypothetical protein
MKDEMVVVKGSRSRNICLPEYGVLMFCRKSIGQYFVDVSKFIGIYV